MKRILVLALLLAVPAVAHARAFDDSVKLTAKGLGPLRSGMTVEEVARALGRGVRLRTLPGSDCATAKLDGRNYLLFTDEVLRRVTLASGQYATKRGLKVGAPEGEVRATYGKRAKRSPHAYLEDGSYFDVAAGARRALRFETDGERITQIHGGRLPEVSYVEGCS